MITIRKYLPTDEKNWVYTKALSYLFSPFFDDMDTYKSAVDNTVFEKRIELVACVDENIVGILDIDIFNQKYSKSYVYCSANKVTYFTNLAVHPDFQGQGIAQRLFDNAKEELLINGVEKLAIFTRESEKTTYLYEKWGAKKVCESWIVIGTPKKTDNIFFSVDLDEGKIKLSSNNDKITYYQREGIYILSEKESMSFFDVDKYFKEITYILDL